MSPACSITGLSLVAMSTNNPAASAVEDTSAEANGSPAARNLVGSLSHKLVKTFSKRGYVIIVDLFRHRLFRLPQHAFVSSVSQSAHLSHPFSL